MPLNRPDPVRGNRSCAGPPLKAFSRIGLINTAYNLIDARGPAQQRSERLAPTGSGRTPKGEGAQPDYA